MTKKIQYTDAELLAAFKNYGPTGYRRYEATYMEMEETYNTFDPFTAPKFCLFAQNKTEAARIAREYGYRFLNKKMVYTYLVPTG